MLGYVQIRFTTSRIPRKQQEKFCLMHTVGNFNPPKFMIVCQGNEWTVKYFRVIGVLHPRDDEWDVTGGIIEDARIFPQKQRVQNITWSSSVSTCTRAGDCKFVLSLCIYQIYEHQSTPTILFISLLAS